MRILFFFNVELCCFRRRTSECIYRTVTVEEAVPQRDGCQISGKHLMTQCPSKIYERESVHMMNYTHNVHHGIRWLPGEAVLQNRVKLTADRRQKP